MLGGWARTSSPREVPRSPPAMPRPGATAPAASSPSPKRQAPPRLARRLIGGVWGEQNLSAPPRSPAPWESGQGAAGRPPLGPGCATAPRALAGDERVAGADRRQRDSRAREGRDAPGRWVIGGRRPRARDGAPPQGTRRHRELHGPRLIWKLSPGHGGQRRERLPPCPYSSANHRTSPNMRSETTLPCASTMTAS